MIPDFQSIMLPALKVFDDDKIITTKDIIGKMVLHFNISEEEQKEKIPSGRAFLYLGNCFSL